MRFGRLAFVVFALVSWSARAGAADPPPQVVLLGDSGIDWREARRIVEQYGGSVLHVLPPGVLVGSIPEGAAEALAAQSGAVRVASTLEEAQALLGATAGASPGEELSLEARAALWLLAPPPAPAGRAGAQWPGNPPRIALGGEAPALMPDVAAPGIGNTFEYTSEFLAGDVGIAVIRPESNGASDQNLEDWTAAEVAFTLTELMAGLAKTAADAPGGKVTFVYRTEQAGASVVAGTVESNYEARSRATFDSNVVLDVLGRLGYTQATAVPRLREWANDVRADLGTDWAVGVFIIDNAVAGGGPAETYLTGPAAWFYGTNATRSIFHHEFGHAFGALDEYPSGGFPSTFAGYTHETNSNAARNDTKGYFAGAGEGLPAVMNNNIDYASPGARGAWGLFDVDGDGIYEPQDTFPSVTVDPPTGTGTLRFTGIASATPLRKERLNQGRDNDSSINRIVRVEWIANGGPSQDAAAIDGSFNSSSEPFVFTTPLLSSGGYVIEVRATDNFGNTTKLPVRQDLTIAGAPNAAPFAALSVTPSLGSTATTFQLSAAGSTDIEDGGALQYRWDFENDGTFDTAYSGTATATRTYGSAGAKTAKVEVKDSFGNTTSRTASFTVSGSNVAPTATFVADKGMVFASAPVTFNLDASGVSDGEDASAALQVRWDFEDDGVWDTGYSATKTVSHDFATGPADNVIFAPASGNTLIFTGRFKNGHAQRFVSATNSAASAEMYLTIDTFTTDPVATPGGTITVGIRSVLTGAFLTSVTRNQSEITQGGWYLFDFPDVVLTAGQPYFLVMISSDNDVLCLANATPPGPGYPNGNEWETQNGGTSWNENTPYDLHFKIHGANTTTVPLTKSAAYSVRMEVKDTNGATSQAVRHVIANGYNHAPSVTLGAAPTSGTTATSFQLTATGADADSATTWDGMLVYRFDAEGDGNYETEFVDNDSDPNTNLANSVIRQHTYARSGIYFATVEVRDRFHATARATTLVTVAPSLAGIAFPAATSCSAAQALTLDAAGMPLEAMLSESAAFAGAVWVPYRPVMPFQLSGAGTKTVYAKVRSGFGNESAVRSATVTYTPGCATVVTSPASGVGASGATLNGTVNPGGVAASGFFQYGLTAAYGSQTTAQNMGSGNTPAPLVATLGGLVCGKTYHYRAAATNGTGTAYGANSFFSTSPCRGPGDLGGDGKTDIMWRKIGAGVDQGAMFLWTMDGTGLAGARYLDPISEDWQVQFTGDFNGDGKSDVLWRNFGTGGDVGKLYIWMMDGPNVVAGTGYTASQADLGWRVDGVGDLNGDGKRDIVWRKTGAGVDKGAVFLWPMNGTGIVGPRYLDPISEDWQVVDLGDFNGDGKADILWRNFGAGADAGKLYIWMMDGPNVVAGTGYTASQADLGWRVDGVGDLNGDGKDDIVWRKTGAGVDKGAVFLWTMDGTGLAGARYLDPIGEDWQVQGVGDFNGDGKVDILWRNQGPGGDTGKLYIWMMDGANVVGGTGYTASQADLGWRVDSPKK
jgi:hypothetical protein